ncbi:MAG: tetratricopeptide repeat protein [Sulfuricurvum sp.]|nr:tetratricopeptide repeat protein [Sulfuricurvum sp.]
MKKNNIILASMLAISVSTYGNDVENGLRAYGDKNFVKSAEYFTKACNNGYVGGCEGLGDMYKDGLGVEQNNFKAAELYIKACKGGMGGGCNNLGRMYELGEGVRQNKAKAKEYYGKACDLKQDVGCSNYAILNKN